jgi:hypothetical protein
VIAAERTCQIRARGEAERSPLVIRFLMPEPTGGGFASAYELECAHFHERRLVPGDDTMEALLRLPMVAHARLLSKEDEGFAIYPYEDDDMPTVAQVGFWGTAKPIYSRGGAEICVECGAEQAPPIDDRSPEESAADEEVYEAARQAVEADMARRRAELPVIPCTREIASRVCQVRGADGSELAPITVRFFAPEPDPEFDFRSEFSLAYEGETHRTRLYGMDGISALLFLPPVAHTLLRRWEDDDCTIFHRTPGDLYDPNFWGVRRYTYDGGRPNICGICREPRAVSPEVADQQRALLRAVMQSGAGG